MPSQWNELLRLFEEEGWSVGEIYREENPDGPILRWKGQPFGYWCQIVGDPSASYTLKMRPGELGIEQITRATMWRGAGPRTGGGFPSVLYGVGCWLEYLRRELNQRDAFGAKSVPDWLPAALPARIAEIEQTVAALEAERKSLADVARLLWQTGEPLTRAVADVFDSFGYSADLTAAGATYDVLVRLDDRRRLFIEVTGIEGAIGKDSKKIGQALAATQLPDFDESTDRVVIAANVFRTTAPDSRSAAPVTAPALAILKGLKTNVVRTDLLYRWSSLDRETARQRVEALWSMDGGLLV